MVVYIGKPTNFLLGHMLSFAAGVMMYISYGDLLRHAEEDLGKDGFYLSNMWFFAGMGFFWLVIHCIPSPSVESIFEPSSPSSPLSSTEKTPSTPQAKSPKSELKKSNLRHRKVSQSPTSRKEEQKQTDNNNNNNSITSDQNSNKNKQETKKMRQKLFTTGLIAALGITLHNFPEGLIVYNASVVCILLLFIYYLLLFYSTM